MEHHTRTLLTFLLVGTLAATVAGYTPPAGATNPYESVVLVHTDSGMSKIPVPPGLAESTSPEIEVPFIPGNAAALAAAKEEAEALHWTESSPDSSPEAPIPNADGIGFTGVSPPDPTIAAGPTQLVAAVNSSWAVHSKQGSNTQLFISSFTDWYASLTNGSALIVDPWIVYDQGAHRFFMVATSRSSGNHYLFLSVSQSDNALGTWCLYRISGSLPGEDTFADYDKIGLSSSAVYLAANDTLSISNNLRGSSLWVFPKAQFTTGDCTSSLGGYRFMGLKNVDGTGAFVVQPALVLDDSPTGFAVNAHVPFSTYPAGNKLSVWTISCPTCSPPNLSVREIFVGDYKSPPRANFPESYGVGGVDTSDGRLLNAAYSNGKLWTAHAVAGAFVPTGEVPSPPGEKKLRSAIRVYEVDPRIVPTLRSISIALDIGADLYTPMVMPDFVDGAAVVFNRSNLVEYPSIYGATKYAGSWQTPFKIKAGEPGSLPNRWGDYGGISINPFVPLTISTLWAFNQYEKTEVPWATRITKLSADTTGSAPFSFDLEQLP